MATRSLSPSYAIAILARQAAIKAVKADLWARGAKLSYIAPKEIRIIANEYLAEHRAELVAQATEKWRAMTEQEFRNDRAGIGVARRTTVSQAS
jgi:hypothetical protein